MRTSEAGTEPEDASRRKAEEAVTRLMNDPFLRGRLSVPALGDRFLSVYRSLLAELAGHRFITDQLAKLHRKDPFLFEHTLNVVTLSAIIGFAHSYDAKRLYELMASAMLFDIGMTDVPDELLTKKGGLTAYEKERVERHTIDGYRLLAGRADVPRSAALCALQHHERHDGSGYPSRLAGNGIHEFARIVAIADTFDALVSPRHHRKSFTRRDAIEFLLGSGDRMFDLTLVKLFVRHISIYPVGSRVKLNNGQVAMIASVESPLLQRPVVRIVRERDGTDVVHPYEIDLRSHLELVIVDTAT